MVSEQQVQDTLARLKGLIGLQENLEKAFPFAQYNVFVLGSYITTGYIPGKSDVDIAVYTEDFDLYKKLSIMIEDWFTEQDICCDIFYIDTTTPAPIYLAPLQSQIQHTDYIPEKLFQFQQKCKKLLDEIKVRMAV